MNRRLGNLIGRLRSAGLPGSPGSGSTRASRRAATRRGGRSTNSL